VLGKEKNLLGGLVSVTGHICILES